jgi:hypothetical protein
MLNSCGNTVYDLRTNWSPFTRLPTAAVLNSNQGVGIYPIHPLLCTHIIRHVTHSFLAHMTEVIHRVFPIIHTTNKNYKNFYLNNLLLI